MTFLDPQCFVNTQKKTLIHRWGNFEEKIRDLREKTPDNAHETTNDLYVLMPTKEDGFGEGVDPFSKKFLAHLWWGQFQNGPLSNSKLDVAVNCKDG